MIDRDPTKEEWALARQAGASFADDTATEIQTVFGQQLMLDGTGPRPGDLYRNLHTGTIATVRHIKQRKYAWVTLRRDGRDTDVTLDGLAEHYVACRPDGRPR